MIDAHCHVHSHAFARLLAAAGVSAVVCGTDPDDAARTERLTRNCPTVCCSFGLHPWKADRFRVEDMLPFIGRCRVLGEIGLDSVWCDVPLCVQERVFIDQLALAARRNMPVILHTKGQERRILELIGQFPNTYLVHWYSCPKDIDRYVALGCYFTLGPFSREDDPVLRHAPLNRILTESDGPDAISWAAGTTQRADYLGTLRRSEKLIERRWDLPSGQGGMVAAANLNCFLNGEKR